MNNTIDTDVERIHEQLEDLRRLFDEDVQCAPAADSETNEEFLLLTLADEAYAFPVAHALEVMHVPTIVPVPGVPQALLGIINFRGQILSVTTIHGVLGLAGGDPGSGGRIIVTKDLLLITGILVDSVEGIIEVAAGDIRPVPQTIDDDRAPLLAGQVHLGNRVVFLLEIEQLCESESLRVTRGTRGACRK